MKSKESKKRDVCVFVCVCACVYTPTYTHIYTQRYPERTIPSHNDISKNQRTVHPMPSAGLPYISVPRGETVGALPRADEVTWPGELGPPWKVHAIQAPSPTELYHRAPA